MNAEIQALNERCARAVEDCVHEWKCRYDEHDDEYNIRCSHCKKYICNRTGVTPPIINIDYSATAGSALEACKRLNLPGPITALDICYYGTGIHVMTYDNAPMYSSCITVELEDYESINRALGVAICQWALKALGEK